MTDVRVGRDARVRPRSTTASSSPSTSCTRTGSARPRRRSAPASSASTRRSPTPTAARRGASRCRRNQGIQFPLVELHTEAAMLRQLIRFDGVVSSTGTHHMEVTHLVAMCNYRANRLACDAADRAMQTCGGVGYSRHMPFEHIYRHHRRYRITEGSEEIQMRKVAQQLFGFGPPAAPDRRQLSRGDGWLRRPVRPHRRRLRSEATTGAGINAGTRRTRRGCATRRRPRPRRRRTGGRRSGSRGRRRRSARSGGRRGRSRRGPAAQRLDVLDRDAAVLVAEQAEPRGLQLGRAIDQRRELREAAPVTMPPP